MKIDLFCNDGSPLGVTPNTIWGRGVGGAELAMMSWAKTMAKRGHDVTIYNNPPNGKAIFDGVTYTKQTDFKPNENRDVYIIFRSPNNISDVKANKKIFWSCDQYTVGNFRTIFPEVDNIVTISPFHYDFFVDTYNAPKDKMLYIDLGVNIEDYDKKVEKVKGQMIFCSIPDRGLQIIPAIWPKLKHNFPHLKLVITSDYTLWGGPANNHRHRLALSRLKDIDFRGKVPRKELVELQLQSEIMLYPCIYEELFCISAAECSVAGALPITSDVGALSSTNSFGIQVAGNPRSAEWQDRYINMITSILIDNVYDFAKVSQRKARSRFSWDIICEQWEKLF